MPHLWQPAIIHQQRFLSSKILSLPTQTNLVCVSHFSLLNRDGQTTNIGPGQTIMLTNNPNSVVLNGQQQPQQSQPICRNLIKQEPLLYAATPSMIGRNDFCYESNMKSTRLWPWETYAHTFPSKTIPFSKKTTKNISKTVSFRSSSFRQPFLPDQKSLHNNILISFVSIPNIIYFCFFCCFVFFSFE